MTTYEEILEASHTLEKDNCSGFVREVAARLGYKLAGDVNALLAYMDKHWVRLKNAMEAVQKASEGCFVVAGARSSDYVPPRKHGHIVVIQPLLPAQMPVGPEDLHKRMWPFVWGGDLSKQLAPKGDMGLSRVFHASVLSKIRYYTPPAPAPHTPPFR